MNCLLSNCVLSNCIVVIMVSDVLYSCVSQTMGSVGPCRALLDKTALLVSCSRRLLKLRPSIVSIVTFLRVSLSYKGFTFLCVSLSYRLSPLSQAFTPSNYSLAFRSFVCPLSSISFSWAVPLRRILRLVTCRLWSDKILGFWGPPKVELINRRA
jgi:hypothetical protein